MNFINNDWLNFSDIEKSDKKNLIEIKDKEDDLILIYPKLNNFKDNSFLNSIRGNIYNKNNGELICMGLPFSKELSLKDDLSFLKDKNFRVYKSFDCTILRLFYYKKWIISTFRKIDAYKSRWGKRSFGELYDECIKNLNSPETSNIELNLKCLDLKEVKSCLEHTEPCNKHSIPNKSNINVGNFINYEKLNKDYNFILCLVHPENGLVCLNKKIKIYHITTFLKDKPIEVDIGLKKLNDLKLGYEKLLDYVKNIDIGKYSGVLLIDSDNNYYKIYNNSYSYLRNIRGDEPNLIIRYLELEDNNEKNFLSLRFNIDITVLEADIKDLVKYIYNNYLLRKKNVYRYINYNNIFNFIKNLKTDDTISSIEKSLRSNPKLLFSCLKEKYNYE